MNTTPIRILVVDDDPDLTVQVRHLLRNMFRPYEVESLTDLPSLAERLAAGGYDAWILDHHLAGVAGDELLRSLPADARRPPVVVVTMSPDQRLSETYLALGAADFLVKDELRPGLLDRTLRFAIAQAQSRHELESSQQDLLRAERLATIGRMAAGVAHEFNNINAVGLAALERLGKLVKGDTQACELLSRVMAALERSRRISASLLKLGRQSETTNTVIDLGARVADSIALLALLAGKSGATLTLVGGGGPQVQIDPNDLHQVLSNLVVNAVHAVHRVKAPVITVTLREENGMGVLTVSDNGVGITAEDLPRVFQPFFSRKGPHDRDGLFPASLPGTGLGLTLCAEMIDRVGGTLELASQPGRGTTATMRLPVVHSAPAGRTPDAPSSASDARPVRTVAIVDDNVELCELMEMGLTDAGLTVHAFVDPARFLAVASSLSCDLVILDWQMPGITGAEVLEHLENPHRSPPLPVIIISGDDPHLPQPVPAGIRILEVVLKPFLVADLLRRIRAS